MRALNLLNLSFRTCQMWLVCSIMVIALTSCKPILTAAYGFKKPTLTTDLEVYEYTSKLDIERDIYRIDQFEGANKGKFQLNSVPHIRAYSPTGYRLLFESTCTADYLDLIEMSIDDLNQLSQDSTENINHWCNYTYQIGTNTPIQASTQSPKFVVVYACYIGRLNKQNTVPWIIELESRNDVDVYLLNVDITFSN